MNVRFRAIEMVDAITETLSIADSEVDLGMAGQCKDCPQANAISIAFRRVIVCG